MGDWHNARCFFSGLPRHWLTAPGVVMRLDNLPYGGDIWAQAPLQAKLAHVS